MWVYYFSQLERVETQEQPTLDAQNEPLLRIPPLDDESTNLAQADLLSPSAKAVLVLESATEIIQLEKELREIDLLAGDAVGSKGVFDNATFNSQSSFHFSGVIFWLLDY